MTKIAPPEFAGLSWSVGDERSCADVTEPFWPIHSAAKPRLFQLGLRVEKTGDECWRVVFTPRYSKPNVQQLLDGIVTEVNALELQQAERRPRV